MKALSQLIDALYDDGIMMIHTGAAALSTSMGQDEIDRLCDGMHKALVSVKCLLEDA